jgi:prepilin-type N-terminal cleavage/methylation domain-containing protein
MSNCPLATARHWRGARAGGRHPTGFSLLEVLMTVVVLSVALIPIFHYFGMAPQRTTQTIHRALALAMANQLLERYRAVSYNVLKKARETLAADPLVKWEALPPDVRAMTQAYQYERDVVLEEIPGETGLALLHVYVRWKLGDIPPREVSLSRVVVDYSRLGALH